MTTPTYSWYPATPNLHFYISSWEEETLDGMNSDYAEPLACAQKIHYTENWQVLIKDEQNNPIEMDPGKQYESLEAAKSAAELRISTLTI